MILRSITTISRLQTSSLYHFSSSTADPYYILGVTKNAPFPQIKKAFYQLANQFHPDKNKSQQAQKKFVIIKQAFESIKMEKGLMKPQHLYRSEDKESIRPNPQKYQTEDVQNEKNFRDYTVFGEKAEENEEYRSFKGSFQAIKDINEIKIRVEKGQMKDTTKRFGLQNFKGRISSYSEGGLKYIFVIMTGLAIFTVVLNQIFNEKETEQKESALKKLSNIHKRKTIQTDMLQHKKKDLANIERSRDIVEMKNKFLQQQIKQNAIGVKFLKDKVVSFSKMESV